jgi:hypothetical protein
VATRPPSAVRAPASAQAAPAPLPHRRRVSPEYLLMLMTSGRRAGPLDLPADAVGPVAAILRAAQGNIGNQALAGLVGGTAAAPELAGGLPGAPAPVAPPEGEAADHAPAGRDPDRPSPADPAGMPADPEPGRPDVPPHAPTPAPAMPGGPRGGGGGGGGAVAAPAQADAGAVVDSAAATAAALPRPAAPAQPAVPRPARPPPSRRAAAQRIPGPPPVPTVEPSFADIPDPIAPATQRIEEVANRLLPEQTLSPAVASPGGHMPVVTEQPLTVDQRRLIMAGDRSMARAELPQEERTRLLAIRAQMLAPVTPAEGSDAAAAPAPTPITVRTAAMPAPDVTVAEQQMFTAVLARVAADPEESARRILREIKATMRDYAGGNLNSDQHGGWLARLGEDKLPELRTHLTDRVNATARTIGAAGAMLDQAAEARRQEVARAEVAQVATILTGAQPAVATVQATAQTRTADAAAARAAAEDARRRARSAGRAPQPGFRATAEAAVTRIRAKVSEGIARFRLQKTERGRELDAARDRMISAYELAVSADEVAAQEANGLGPNQTPPTGTAELRRARRLVSEAVNRAQDWRDRQIAAVRAEVQRFKTAANTAADTNILDVEDEGAAAFRDLRDWGDTQEGATEQWWQDTVTNLDTWADAAHETATTWAEAEGRLARLEMQRDLAQIRSQMERSIAAEAEGAANYARMSEDQKRDFVANIVSTSRDPDFLERLSNQLMAREIAEKRPGIEPEVERQLRALPRQAWDAIELAAQAKNSEFSARRNGDAIYAAGANKTFGTDEAAIFRQLDGLRSIELFAVTQYYNNLRRSDTALYDDLDAELSGDEWRRAEALMAGDPVAAAVEAIHDAVWGPGTNEAQIMAALRSIDTLPEDQRSAARTRLDRLYRDRYGESIDTVLSGDMEGSELGQAQAIYAGNPADAEAYEMDVALRGGWGRDAGAATAVYERIRTEGMTLARQEGWTEAEFDAYVARRNGAMSERFGEHFSGVSNYRWGSGTVLENAVGWTFARDRGTYDMLNAFQRGDMEAVDAGRMEAERRSGYADDEVMGNVVRAQLTRGLDRAQLARGPELRARNDSILRREIDAAQAAHTPLTERRIRDRRMELQREMDAALTDEAFERARASTAAIDRRLLDRYGVSLDTMLTQTMSNNVFGRGGALSNAQERLRIYQQTPNDGAGREQRRLDWAYSRLRAGIEGAGTEMDELRGGLTGLTRDQMRILDKRWQTNHGGETLRAAVESDTSGRESDDLVDIVENGAALTTEDQLRELRRRLTRDEASVGGLGAYASRSQAAASHASLERLEALSADLDNPNLPPERRAGLSAVVDQGVQDTRVAIESQRAEVDSYADAFTTVLQYLIGAVALVLGVVAGIVTGGAAVPALIAIAGSVIGTLSGMAAKAAIKGGAYGAGEIATDLVVGAVDLLVTLATVGAFKGSSLWGKEFGRTIFGAAREGMRNYGRATIRGTLRQVAQRTVGSAAERAVEGGMRRGIGSRAASFGRQFFTNQGQDLVTAIPTAIAANMMNEENWRGNVFANIAHGTIEASIENLKNGMVMGIGGTAVHAGIGRFMHVEHRPLTPLESHARDLRMFRELNPRSSHADFVAHIEAQQAQASAHADAVRAAVREARQELLGSLPPRERGAIADVPILHVGEAQFRALNKGNYGDALIHVHEGQAVIVVREGAPAAAVRGLASDLRQVVAPGTAGRTVNPVDSLPPRLRNRLDSVRVNHDPTFGPTDVVAVPIRNKEGHITGVALEVGPNATAADIQGHVATIDAMRRLAGVAGHARILLNDMGRAMGMDLVSPRDHGHWEAALEVAKLPRLIDERIQRLSEHGLDPRRRALVMEEIAGLERQLAHERARFALGADAPSVGHVAARPGRKGPTAGDTAREAPAAGKQRVDDPAPPDPTKQGTHTKEPLSPEAAHDFRRQREIVDEFGRIQQAEEALRGLEAEHYTQLAEFNDRFKARWKGVTDIIASIAVDSRVRRTPELRRLLNELKGSNFSEAGLQSLSRLLSPTDHGAAFARLGKGDSERIRTMRELVEAWRPLDRMVKWRQDAVDRVIPERRAQLRAEFLTLRGNIFNHNDPSLLGHPGRIPCLAADTVVLTDSGKVAIAALAVGDAVLTDQTAPSRISAVTSGRAVAIVELLLGDGSRLVATRNHCFRTVRPCRWMPARLLYPGLLLDGSEGAVEVREASLALREVETRNLIVEPAHTFRIGPGGVLVHNGDPEEFTSNWANTEPHDARIYAVFRRDQPGVIIYIGKTRMTVQQRWNGHLGSDSKRDQGWTRATHDIREVQSGRWTDFETAVWEEHYIREHRGLKPGTTLVNDIHAITDDQIRRYGGLHKPCG